MRLSSTIYKVLDKPKAIKGFHGMKLPNLEVATFPHATQEALKIVAQNCPKLKYLRYKNYHTEFNQDGVDDLWAFVKVKCSNFKKMSIESAFCADLVLE